MEWRWQINLAGNRIFAAASTTSSGPRAAAAADADARVQVVEVLRRTDFSLVSKYPFIVL